MQQLKNNKDITSNNPIQNFIMENYALSIANYFIDLAKRDKKPIRPLKLMKLVYIAHGYILALLDKPTEGTKLEKVQAWQYGPVFPSVYYSFKQYGRNPIDRKTTVFDFSKIGTEEDLEVVPTLKDKDEKAVCDFVWKKYGIYTDSTLVSILHADGTPWKQVYKPGMNKEIPDSLTKSHYQSVIDKTLENVRRSRNQN